MPLSSRGHGFHGLARTPGTAERTRIGSKQYVRVGRVDDLVSRPGSVRPWEHGEYMVLSVIVGLGVLVVTGWWRYAFALFRIRPEQMTVDRLGLMVRAPEDVERVNNILSSFAGGFNAMIARPSPSAWRRYCNSLPVVYRPFAHEGAAMGYTLRHLFWYNSETFENRLVRPRPEFRYLYYVGLGFWSGMRRHQPEELGRRIRNLDPLHRYLCYDGYGFKHAFFDEPKDPQCLRRLDRFEGYARNASYQGVGRAYWFRFLGDPAVLIDRIDRLGEYAGDAAAGVGLAMAFVNPDRLERALAYADRLPQRWHEDVHLGLCFGLKARSINDADRFQRDMARLDFSVREAVFASIRECDRVELVVRSDGQEDGYRRWRRVVTRWMADNIEYPLAGVRQAPSRAATVRERFPRPSEPRP